jgi:hypothetical protein
MDVKDNNNGQTGGLLIGECINNGMLPFRKYFKPLLKMHPTSFHLE